MDLLGLSSFNDLPLAVPQPAFPCLGGELSPSSSGEGSPGAVPLALVPGPSASRHALPRRHASDVELLARPSGPLGALPRPPSGGVLDAGAGGEVPSRSQLESSLVALWEDRADRGLFRWGRCDGLAAGCCRRREAWALSHQNVSWRRDTPCACGLAAAWLGDGLGRYEPQAGSGPTSARSVLTLCCSLPYRTACRYDVSQCATRVLPGRLGFVAQLNEGRANKKRPTEFRVDQVGQRGNWTRRGTLMRLRAGPSQGYSRSGRC